VDEHVTFDFPWTSPEAKYEPSRYDARALMRLFGALRRQRFDVSFDCRMDARGNVVTFLAGARTRVGHAFGGATWLLTHPVSVENHSAHKAADWLRLLAPFGGNAGAEPPRLYLTDEERAQAAAFISNAGITDHATVVGVHPGGSRPEKRWPLQRFAGLVQQLAAREDVRVIVFADPAGYGRELGQIARVVVMQSQLRQLMALIERCSLFLCNDSGPMHLAGALGVPAVAVFGSGTAEWFSPLGHGHRVVTRRGLECRPCYGSCRYSEPFCLTRIPVGEVWDEVEAALATSRATVAATTAGSIAS
jgi:heptosyltransferase-2